MDVEITTEGSKVHLTSPYNPEMPPKARQIGGRWDAARKAWAFDVRDLERVRDLARAVYGTDGSPADTADLVTVRTKLAHHQVSEYPARGRYAEFAGRRIAERIGRDQPVKFAPGVVLVEGTLPRSGGSMRYPAIDAGYDVVVEIRDLPRAALSIESADLYEIVEDAPAPAAEASAAPVDAETPAVDVEALLAERERLLARIAEIDALLPEPEGTEMTTRQAAAALGVSIRTVQRWAQRGTVTASKDTAGRWTITITTATDTEA